MSSATGIRLLYCEMDLATYHLICPNNTMDDADTKENIPAQTSPG